MCAAAIGTEADGSIVCPAGNNLVVGIKPTLGMISQEGIIPIAHSQDTAGPITRTVTDAAILLGILQSPFGAVARRPLPTDYTRFLRRGALRGARIGVDRRFFSPDFGGLPEIVAVVEQVGVLDGDRSALPERSRQTNVRVRLGLSGEHIGVVGAPGVREDGLAVETVMDLATGSTGTR